MATDRWSVVGRLVDDALDLPLDRRREFVDRACGADIELRAQINGLLAACERAERATGFLDGAAGEYAEPVVAHLGAHIDTAALSVPTDLEIALGERYTLEREVGRGGMAVVYLAQDFRIGRRVAVKVLKPELAIALGQERFIREIRTVASLTHPHIVPLLDTGEVAATAYFTMPFVEGESLREKLDHEPQLPLDTALGIAAQVADALDCAHRHNIVHRDIKPDNILLQEGHAVVADFGVARAIARAGGEELEEKLTATGVTFGTPAYMSPEQASGDRAIDGRSDIYSLGSVLYEMLAGEPPYRASSTAALLTKIMTFPVPSLQIDRPGLPDAVDKLVQRCLAKAPADRFQTAGELREALRSVASFTRPIAESVIQHEGPVAPEGTAMRFAAPLDVTEASATPPAAVNVDRFRRAMGLGVARGRRAVARVTGARPKSLMLTTLSIVAVAGGFVAWSRTHAPGTSVAVSPPPHTIVAEVSGTAPTEVRAAVRNLISIRINQSGVLRTVAAGDLERGYELAGLPDSTSLDVRTARELAYRGNIRTVVSATADQLGNSLALTVQVLDAKDGSVVAAEGATARDDDDIIESVGHAIDALRDRLGERRGEILATRPIGGVATPSFDAFKHFVRAQELAATEVGNAGCLRELRNALRYDAEFAAAWFHMGFCHNRGFIRRDSAVSAWRRAWVLRDRLGEATQNNLEGILAMADGDASAALEAFARPLPSAPDGLLHNRALVLAEWFGRYEEAAELHATGRARAPFGPTRVDLLNGARTLIALGRFAEAESLDALHPPAVRSPVIEFSLAAARHDWDKLASSAHTAGSNPSSSPVRQATSARALAGAYAARGRLRDASETLQNAARAGLGDVKATNRSEWLLAVVRQAVGDSSNAPRPAPETRTWRGLWAAYEGDSAGALAHLAEARATGELAFGLEARMTHEVANALIDARRGRDRQVLAILSPSRSVYYQIQRWWFLADAYERLGKADSMAIYLGQVVANAGILDEDNLLCLGIIYPFAHFRLARHFSRVDDGARAEHHYVMFLNTFTRPDPDVAWMVGEARNELQRLVKSARLSVIQPYSYARVPTSR